MGKTIKWLALLGLGVAAMVVAYGFWFLYTPVDHSRRNEKVEFELVRGMTPLELSIALEKRGVVRDHLPFYVIGKLMRHFGNIKAAEYELNFGMTPNQIYKVLQSGIGIHRELLVREGENIYQVADTFHQLGLGKKEMVLKLLRNRELIEILGLGQENPRGEIRSLEGYLYPNTYFFERRDQAVTVIRRMVDAFLRDWTPAFDDRAREIGMNRHQVVILASIIEREAAVPVERPIISSVFHNRLKKGMRLQSDPTTIYGVWETYDGILRKKDLQKATEFNTYTVPALPIGPISNPSAGSIFAALYPAETPYLYFVSRNDRTHLFSENYEDHRVGVKRFQIDQKTRPTTKVINR